MRNLILAFLVCACTSLRSGDLVFVAAPSGEMDEAIAQSTGAFTHVAILEVAGDSAWVLDATPAHGVSRRPLSQFIQENGPDAVYAVKRVRDSASVASLALARARSLCGLPYDLRFLPGNDAYYCSELVQVCFLSADGTPLFPSAPMNWLAPDGTLPSFWQQNFAALGMDVPQGVPGTNPAAMAASPFLEDVACGETLGWICGIIDKNGW